jgi:hypothetical protein
MANPKQTPMDARRLVAPLLVLAGSIERVAWVDNCSQPLQLSKKVDAFGHRDIRSAGMKTWGAERIRAARSGSQSHALFFSPLLL